MNNFNLTQEQLLKVMLLQAFRNTDEAKAAYEWVTAGNREEPIEVGSDEPLEPFNEETYYSENYPFNIPLADCDGISCRTYNIMKAMDIVNLGDLCGWPRRYIQRLRGLGKKSYMELTNALRKHNLQWEMWTSPSYKAAYPPKL